MHSTRTWFLRILISSLTIIFLMAFPSRAQAQTPSDIAKQLICGCGCIAVLDNCTHGECSVRDEMITLVKQKLAEGKTEAQVLSFFVGRYGEKVLASPPKKGFNLTAWILPFAAILAGGALIFFLVKKWVWRGRAVEAGTFGADSAELDTEYEIRLEKELRDFKSRGFR